RPYGVAVDGSGNVFIGDTGNRAVFEILAVNGTIPSSPTIRTLGGGFSFGGPVGLSLDGNGNVFVADRVNQAVYEIMAEGDYTTVNNLASGQFACPYYTAVDGSGNVFLTDYGSENATGFVKEIMAAGGYTTVRILAFLLYRPVGVTVDSTGNVYFTERDTNRLVKLSYADPPNVTFPAIKAGYTRGPRTVIVNNVGNADLNILDVAYAKDFPEAAGPNTDCTSSSALASGESCTLSINFSPLEASVTGASSLLSESVSLTDNNLNQNSSTQSVAVSGTVIANPPIGTVDRAVDSTTGVSVVGQSDQILITGWAADPQQGAPVTQVQILIDGNVIGNATLGLVRPEIAAFYNNPAYTTSGWT